MKNSLILLVGLLAVTLIGCSGGADAGADAGGVAPVAPAAQEASTPDAGTVAPAADPAAASNAESSNSGLQQLAPGDSGGY